MSYNVFYLVTLLDIADFALVLPLQTRLIFSLGGNVFIVGLLTSLASGAKLISSPVIGSLSDTIGRKALLITTLWMTVLFNIISGLPYMLTYIIARVLYSGTCHTDLLLRTIISDKYPKDEASKVFQKLGTCTGLGFMIVPLLSGFLYEALGHFYYISAICCLLNLAQIGLIYFYIQESSKSKNKKTDKSEGFLSGFSKIFDNLKSVDYSKYGDLLLAKLFMEITFSFLFMNTGIILMETYEYSTRNVGVVISCISITGLMSSLCTPLIIKTFYSSDSSGYVRILHGFTTMLVTLLLLPFTNSAITYLSVMLSAMFVKTFIDLTITESINGKATETDKGTIMGANASMMSLSRLISPLINGIVNSISTSGAYWLPIIPLLVGNIVFRKIRTVNVVEKNK